MEPAEPMPLPIPPDYRRGRLPRWIALVLVAAAFTMIQIQYSFDKYRLAELASYDDVSYFCDALVRIDTAAASEAGYKSLLAGLATRPPHSPFSSIMATAAFLIFGIRDWAPYLLNGLIILALLACVDYFLRGARLWQRIVVAAIVLCIPLAGVMVLDFRPDTAWGLCAAMAVLLPLRRNFLRASWRYHLACGAWFAAALLCKPPMFPLTLCSVVMAWLLATICDRLEDPAAVSVRSVAAAWGIGLIPPLLLALPHYLDNWHHIYTYTFVVAFGQGRKAAAMTGGIITRLRFFLDGGGGGFIYHTHIKMILAVLLFGGVYVYRRAARGGHEDHVRLARAVSMAIVAGFTYAVPTAVGLGNPFFGVEFQTITILGMVIVLRMFLASSDMPAARLFGAATVIVCMILGFWHLTFPQTWSRHAGSPEVLNNTRVIRSVEQVLLDHAAPGTWVFLTATGWLNSETLQYVARQDGKWLNISDGAESEDPRIYKNAFNSVDIVVAAEPGVDEFNTARPGLPWDQTLAMIRAHGDFHQIGQVRSASGKYFYIFERNVPFRPQG
jgi:Dolichyl-phosphate-mannose-protein mannosyltransferase